MVSESLVQDIRYGARLLRRNPGVTAIAIFALALGIGVNTAAFTAYRAMIARSLDARDPDRMANVALIRQSGETDFTFSYPEYETYRHSLRSFTGVIAENHKHLTLSDAGGVISQRTSVAGSLVGRLGLLSSGAGNAEYAMTFMVSANYFSVLGVQGIRGRSFEFMGLSELWASPPVLISENYWQKRFGGDEAILGKTIRLNNVPFTVIGITPRDFVGTFVAVPDFWIPLRLAPLVHADDNWLHNAENECCRLFGRLAPGISMAQAQAEVNLLANHLRTRHAPRSEQAAPVTASVWPGSPFPRKLAGGLKLAVLLIMLAVGMVLVVACANVASLQLARAVSRQNEIAMRLSLGASPRRILRQLLTESVLLALIAGGVALLFTSILLKAAVTMAADAFPAENGTLIFYVNPDMQIFAYVFAVSLVAGLLFGLAPALEGSRYELKAHRGTSVRSRRLQKYLVATQVAVSTVLLISGALFIRSSVQSLRMDPGYQSRRVVNLELRFPEWAKYGTERKIALVREVRTRLAELQGVAAVTSARAPNASTAPRTASVSLTTEVTSERTGKASIYYSYVQENYFGTLGIPILFGTGLHSEAGREHSVVLSESAARGLWPGQNPIGQSLRLTSETRLHKKGGLRPDGPAYRVIGVVRDTRGFQPDGSDSRQVYLQMPEDQVHEYPILIRTRADANEFIRELEPVISSVDPGLVAYSSSLDDLLRQTPAFIMSSLAAGVASTVGVMGLLLASLGLYGTVSFIVALRTREVGIRMAVGAQRGNILALILVESFRPVLAGLLLGMLLSAGVSYLLRGLLYGVRFVDGLSFMTVFLLYSVTALLAAGPPLRRAMRVDPTVALRHE